MNRKKKLNSIFNSRLKRAKAKLSSSNKPKYISKADREALAKQQAIDEQSVADNVEKI